MIGLKFFKSSPLRKAIKTRQRLIDDYYHLEEYSMDLENQILWYTKEKELIDASQKRIKEQIDSLDKLN